MNYCKYALALILLATSAFSSASFQTDDQLNDLASRIKDTLTSLWHNGTILFKSGEPKIIYKHYFDLKEMKDINLTEKQKQKLLKNINFKIYLPIFNALKSARDEEIAETADFITKKANGKEVSLGDSTSYEGKLTDEQITEIKEFENNVGGWPLKKEDIENFLFGKGLPKPLSMVEKIWQYANGGNISGRDKTVYGSALKEEQYNSIKMFESKSGRGLTETEISDYLEKGQLLPYSIDQRIKEIIGFPPGKIGEASEITEFAEPEQISAIKALEQTGAKVSEKELKEILSGSGIPTPVPPPPAPSPDDDLATKILNLIKSGKIDAASIKGLGVTDAQIIKKLIETKNLDSKEKVEAILNAAQPAPDAPVPGKATEVDTKGALNENSKYPWYTNPWYLGIGGILLFSTIGGGVYMMTRKTNETEL